MSIMTQERLNSIKEKVIWENARSIYELYEYTLQESKVELGWLYEKNKAKFIRKFKLKYPQADESEIKFSFRIYLTPEFDSDKNDLGDYKHYDKEGNEWPINSSDYIGIYWKDVGDYNYGWFIKNDGSGLYLP